MGAVTGTLKGNSEFAGGTKVITVTAPIAASSDTITLTAGSHGGITGIVGILGAVISAGADAALQTIQVSATGLVITVDSFAAGGGVATNWTNASVEIGLLVSV